ncbi:hypothetical protein BN77_p2180075 [Rhizobium mesoamericanum STM3625]|uniref:Uncharacterized protein n=1 Tax=Rhizobium mesoamericanum STM3625 TaxID=1211777 RepID=K0Q4S9_9HYPH|nr:hypothetical protein BN77_p2180075 [Rhizobium mesoamericanum STM3625]
MRAPPEAVVLVAIGNDPAMGSLVTMQVLAGVWGNDLLFAVRPGGPRQAGAFRPLPQPTTGVGNIPSPFNGRRSYWRGQADGFRKTRICYSNGFHPNHRLNVLR